ncbi:TldD/PmbA family protein [Fusibacter ferrireducens]|uniref:TldD/PmbA family protein n=1 Tax=Fusibacter ferrireducens TaxID=2785058 RepID=A0ABR9ZZ62_9FIRM|nr:TldD/PmbA family protein [Fusibacter ferrireducens]MBF4695744.1 TldD/PmbA family protein [Fusibacter ferrireducens]
MYIFPKDLYVDVRIEESFDTKISFKKKCLIEQKIRKNTGAFIRVFDGKRWYYSSISEVDLVQEQIDKLAQMATPNPHILEHPVVQKFEVNQTSKLNYANEPITNLSVLRKRNLLESRLELLDDPIIVNHTSFYVDNRTVKQIYTSKGTEVIFDKQTCGIRMSFDIAYGESKDQVSVSKGFDTFEALEMTEEYFRNEIQKTIEFVKNAVPVVGGEYTVLLSPMATGVFTHESFGHKSESDFMVGDETMQAEWTIGKSVANEIVTIVDDGNILGNGFVPFDDEGTEGKKTMIITDGILTGRLHSTQTAALLQEDLTGNARAMNFEFEPIVRMTTTYLEKGDRPLKEIISEIDKGIFVDTIIHGSGLSTFTLAPSRAYMIENGKISQPVRISVVTGNVFETLSEVDAVSSEFEFLGFVGGGCGKMEQWPLPVGFGGPYTKVRKLNVQ